MKLIKKSRKFLTLLICWLVLSSWGYKGHEIIGGNFGLSFNQKMVPFESWIPILAYHSGDADKRKSWDKTESNKHYIDIDNYPEFVERGKINQNLAELLKEHGENFVDKQGILPWATVNTYDSLVASFEKQDFNKAALIAADLSHYVADGHMPLHSTANYDGQLSGNKGVHARYESDMVNRYQSSMVYNGIPVAEIANVPDYVFNYIYESYGFVDSVLHADTYAHLATSSVKSAAYLDTLWLQLGDLTISRFQKASYSIASLVYTAWLQAGSPAFDNETISPEIEAFKTMLSAVYYRDSLLMVEFGLNEPSAVLCEVFSDNGNKIFTKDVGYFEKGLHHFELKMGIPKGAYLFSFNYNKMKETHKFSVW